MTNGREQAALVLRVEAFRTLYSYFGAFRRRNRPDSVEIVELPRPTMDQVVGLPVIGFVGAGVIGVAKKGMGSSVPWMVILIISASLAAASLIA